MNHSEALDTFLLTFAFHSTSVSILTITEKKKTECKKGKLLFF
jgi:hypothetical protein